MSLEDLGLVPTSRKYIEKFSEETKIAVDFLHRGEDKALADKNLTLTIFRVIQEALNNIRKHSEAKTASVILEFALLGIAVKITDTGKGFNTELVKVEKDDCSVGFGLLSMNERIELLNGTMQIKSQPGEGTVIKIVLPYTENWEEHNA